MKRIAQLSILLNAFLLVGLGLLWWQWQRAASLPVLAVPATVPAAAISPAPLTTPPPPPAAPFAWSQLYNKDYHLFVRNLRAAGCPECTVRAIVEADVNAVFRLRVKEIETQLASLDHGWSNQMSATALRNEMQNVPDAEAAEIADLLGLPPAVQSAPRPIVRREKPIVPPLVMQNVDLTELNLSAEQQQTIANIRQDFVDQVGGANQDPDDPAYLARWQRAQPAADGLLQAMLGYKDYTTYEVLAQRTTLASQNAQP